MSRRLGQIKRTHCQDCKVELTLFNSVGNGFRLRRPRCRDCNNQYLKDYRNKDKEATSIRNRKYNLKRLYNLTPEEYKEMYDFQQGGCAICRKHFDVLAVDHSHTTGEIRGLLCDDCNKMIGFAKEDESVIWGMLEYLKRTTWKDEVA